MPDPILFSGVLNGPRRGQNLNSDEITAELEGDNLAWVHLDRAHPDTRNWLVTKMPYLDTQVVDALLAEETRPRMTEIGDGMLVILRGINMNEGSQPEDMVSIRLWADPTRIVTLRRRKVHAAQDIEDRINAGKGPETAGQFVTFLTERLVARMESVLRRIDDSVDEVEEKLLTEANSDLHHPITDVRRRTIQLRRYIAPQREAVSAIRSSLLPWIKDVDRRQLAEVQDNLTRFVEDLDSIRERAQVAKDELANTLAERLNRTTYFLTVVAAIFLPLGFLTGLWGVNVGGVPGQDNPGAFLIFSGILAVIVAAQVIIFRWLRWF